MKTNSLILVAAALQGPALAGWGDLPIRFEENRGQAAPDVRFVSHGAGYTLALSPSEARFRADGAPVTMRIAGGNPAARATGELPLETKSHYLTGSASAWRTGIANFGRVRFASVYPGIDIVYYGAGSSLEYDFIVQPGARPDRIRLAFDGPRSARVNPAGDLVLETAHGEAIQRRPRLYQERAGKRVDVAGGYRVLAGGAVGFQTGAYDPKLPLVIDPVLQFATFWGGQIRESASAIAVDREGNLVVAGTTSSSDYPVSAGAFQRGLSSSNDFFVLKLDPRGTRVIFSTYVGGNDDELGGALAITPDNGILLAGSTNSSSYPTTGQAYRQSSAGGTDGVISKLAPDGSRLIFSTRAGGRGSDFVYSVATDRGGNAYVTGETYSSDYPVTEEAFQTERKGPNDAFVTKVTADGSRLEWSTLLGGDVDTPIAAIESGRAIAVDTAGFAWVAGRTSLKDFPVKLAFQDFYLGLSDVFLTRLSTDGKRIEFSTYLGSEGDDVVTAITVDQSFNATLVGYTDGFRWPVTQNPIQAASWSDGRTTEGWVTKMSASGQPVYSTFFGHRGDDRVNAVTTDAAGNAYIAGSSNSRELPTTIDAPQRGLANAENSFTDAFVFVLDPNGSAIKFGTFFGGSRNDEGNAVAVDTAGNIYVAGFTNSSNLPITAGALQSSTGFGTNAAFIARIGDEKAGASSLRLISGDRQSIEQTAPFRNPFVVEARDTFGAPLVGATIAFTASTNVTLSAATAVTGLDGRAQIRATAGIRPGAATIRATLGVLPPVEFNVTVLRVGPAPPEITTGSIVGAGGSVPPVRVLSPGMMAVVTGFFFTQESGQARGVTDADLVDGRLPISLLGTCVTVGGQVARIEEVGETLVRFQVPELNATGSQPVQVISNCGRGGELRSETEPAEIARTSPEFAFWSKFANGRNPVQAIFTDTGAGVGPGGVGGFNLSPARPNDNVTIFAYGLGETVPASGAGELPRAKAPLRERPVVILDGNELPADSITYAGLAPVGQAGLYQVEFRVPADVRNGNLTIELRSGLRLTPAGGYLAITGGANLVPQISVAPAAIDFGDVILGQSKDFQVAITNLGGAALDISAFNNVGPGFSVIPNIGFIVRAGDTRIVTLRYTPTVLARVVATFSIASADPARPVVNIPVTANVINQPPTPNPEPALRDLSPSAVDAGSPGFNLIVNGSNFSRLSVVEFNGRSMNTFFNHPGQLIVNVSSADIVNAGEIRVTVNTPPPGGGRTQAVILTVRAAAPVTGSLSLVNQLDLRFCPVITAFVQVRDANRNPVRGITTAACSEDGIGVDCRVVPAAAEVPMSVSIAAGFNGLATEEDRILLKQAMRQFVQSLPDTDRIQLIHLDDARELVPFTADKQLILNRIEDLRPVGPGNLMVDAAWFAMQSAVRETGRRQAVVLFTGAPNVGGFLQDYTQVVGPVRELGVPFFTFAIGQGANDNALGAFLRQFARDTQGEFVQESDARNFQRHFGALSTNLQSQYLVEFRSNAIDGRQRTARFNFNLGDGTSVTGARSYIPCLR